MPHPFIFPFRILPLFTLSSVVLSVIIASLIALVFFLVFGHGWLRLVVYWLIGLAGFFFGQMIASFFNFSLLPIGSVNILEASAACLVALFLTRALWKG